MVAGESARKVFAVVGYPLEHTFSPFLHHTIFDHLGFTHTYIPWEVAKGELKTGLGMLRRNLAGFNVTAPYKQEIKEHLDDVDLSAEIYEAVNVVKNENGRLVGFNTDGYGFLQGLNSLGYEIQGKNVLILGAGGAAQTISYELAHRGCALTIANRSETRVSRLLLKLKRKFPHVKVKKARLNNIPRGDYQCVINATPVGMGSLRGETPLHSQYLSGVELVYDLIYNPKETKLLQLAQALDCKTINGLDMLVYQGLKAQEIWLGHTFSEEEAAEILLKIKKEAKAWLKS